MIYGISKVFIKYIFNLKLLIVHIFLSIQFVIIAWSFTLFTEVALCIWMQTILTDLYSVYFDICMSVGIFYIL